MSEIVGYVIYDQLGPLTLGHYPDTPKGGVLMQGDDGTIFRTRNAARQACQRTSLYATQHGLQWGCWQQRIKPVRMHEPKEVARG